MAKAKAKQKRSIPPKIPHPYPHPRWAPLNSTWFVSSLIGIIISTLYVSKYSLPWATAFTVVFVAMLIAGFVSMRGATPDGQLAMPHKRK